MKKIKYIYCLGIIFLFTFSGVTFGQSEVESQDKLEIKIESLEREIKLSNEINIKILETIYWALGGLLAVFLGVIGLNFFQNFNINKGKIDNLEENLKNLISEKALLSQKETSLILDEKAKEALIPLKKEINSIKDSVHEMKRHKIEDDIEKWKEKHGDYYIPDLLELLNLDIRRDWDWRIIETLTTILEAVSLQTLDSGEIADLQTTLEKLPSKYSTQKLKIQEKI